ncbi:helix-turn-helix domain-containing protein [Streptomyces smyrnaeus]|uniref:helix-turn-helix domain-containing protein n=1 Tax=Streptomyces smyrnaeus TaxID=1387713 RepID=UPI0033DC889E
MKKQTLRAAVERAQADGLLSPRQVHEEYGFSPQTLANWRWKGLGPDYIKQTPGKSGRIKYRRSAIERFLADQTVRAGEAA